MKKLPLLIVIVSFVLSCSHFQDKVWHSHVSFLLEDEDLPEYELDIDHVKLIGSMDEKAFSQGEAIYRSTCQNCHGTPYEEGSLPSAQKFWKQNFKVGSDPYSLYQTITRGFSAMPPQTYLSPKEKYDVIHYIREAFIRSSNPIVYVEVNDHYLRTLPDGKHLGPDKIASASWEKMDYGNFLINAYELVEEGTPERVMSTGRAPVEDEDFSGANMVYKGIAIRLDGGHGGVANGKIWALFDQDLFRIAGVWSGEGFIDWNGILLNGKHNVTPRNVGKLHYQNPVEPAWANPLTGRYDDPRFEARDGRKFGPLPKDWADYKGLYTYDDKVVINYGIGGANILEKMDVETWDGKFVFTRTLNIEHVKTALKMRVAPVGVSVELVGNTGILQEEDGYTVLKVPVVDKLALKLLISESEVDLRKLAKSTSSPKNLIEYTRGGRSRYPEIVKTKITKRSDGPFIVDELTLPADNPWNSRIQISGIDFFDGGDEAVISCVEGDIWSVSGLNDPSMILTWRRIASGLFQPLGIKIIKGEIYVGCRDQIVILKDLNGDGEIDFYHNFNNDHQVTDHFHEFAMGLQADAEGNLYYAKSARHAREALVPQHGTLLKVSKDGLKTEIIAHGFRAANGVCINPDGSFLITDQEGHWNPMNRINWVDKNGFYGNMFGYNPPKDSSDSAMIAPMLWVDLTMDRSPAELLWVTSKNWGPFHGSLLNLSYGYGKIYLVPHEKVKQQMQGAIFELPIPPFPTGIIRGKFNPVDGHLYVCGMSAWATQQTQKPGGLYRVRYADKSIIAPLKVQARSDGVRLVFSTELDKKSTENLNNYKAKSWKLKRSAEYGSDRYNEINLVVSDVSLEKDGKSVEIKIMGMAPVDQLELTFKLKDVAGIETEGRIHSTIHNLL